MRYVKLNVDPCVRDRLWSMSQRIGLPMTEILKVLIVELYDIVVRMLEDYVKYRRLGIPTDVEIQVKPRVPLYYMTEKFEECVEVSSLTNIGKDTLPKCVIVDSKKYRVLQNQLLRYPEGIDVCKLDVDLVQPSEYELKRGSLSLCRCLGIVPWWRITRFRNIIPPEEVQYMEELWSTTSNIEICYEISNPERWFYSRVRLEALGNKASLPRYNWLELVREEIEKFKEELRTKFGLDVKDIDSIMKLMFILPV